MIFERNRKIQMHANNIFFYQWTDLSIFKIFFNHAMHAVLLTNLNMGAEKYLHIQNFQKTQLISVD